MKPLHLVALFLSAVLSVAPLRASTRATDYPGSVCILLGVDKVQEDLHLNPKQKARLATLREDLKEKARALTEKATKDSIPKIESEKELFSLIDTNNDQSLAVLSAPQLVRFNQLQNQALGYSMLVSPKIQSALQLTAKQSASIEGIRLKGLEFVAETNKTFLNGTISHQKRMELLRNYRLEQAEAMMRVLTSEQRKKFAELSGAPLKS